MPVEADAFSQLKLLDVQELDTRLDQLRHRLATLPETGALAALGTERAQVDGEARDARILVDDLTREQRKADTDVEQVKTRRTRDQDRMDRGLVGSPRTSSGCSRSWCRWPAGSATSRTPSSRSWSGSRRLRARADRLTVRLAEIDGRVAELTASRDRSAGQASAEAETVAAERKVTATGVPADLLALYERIRAQKGTGAAALLRRRCTGCSLELTAADLGAVARAPLDEVVRCEECQRILVRTAESGI